jgi:hypothetical protein
MSERSFVLFSQVTITLVPFSIFFYLSKQSLLLFIAVIVSRIPCREDSCAEFRNVLACSGFGGFVIGEICRVCGCYRVPLDMQLILSSEEGSFGFSRFVSMEIVRDRVSGSVMSVSLAIFVLRNAGERQCVWRQ